MTKKPIFFYFVVVHSSYKRICNELQLHPLMLTFFHALCIWMKIENTLCVQFSREHKFLAVLFFNFLSFYALFVVVVVDFTIFQSNKLLVLACYCCHPDQPDRKERKKRGRRKKSTTKCVSLTRLSSFFNSSQLFSSSLMQNSSSPKCNAHLSNFFSLSLTLGRCCDDDDFFISFFSCSSLLSSCAVVMLFVLFATSRFCWCCFCIITSQSSWEMNNIVAIFFSLYPREFS